MSESKTDGKEVLTRWEIEECRRWVKEGIATQEWVAEESARCTQLIDGVCNAALLTLSAREPRVTAVIEAARLLSDSLDGGFVRCMRCGDQEDTSDLDFAPELRKALAELDAIHSYVGCPSKEQK